MTQKDADKKNKNENAENEELEELKKALAEEKARAETNLAGWQRAQADFINYKRFTEQEKAETSKFANANLILNLLPALDDFERALSVIPSDEANRKWLEGFSLIERKFREALEKHGVTDIKALGEEFDCHLMEAVICGPGKKDIVTQELEKGYKLYDKVIRPAKVVVGSGEESEESTNQG